MADAVIVKSSMTPLAFALAATEGLICDYEANLNLVSIGLQARCEKRRPLLRKGEVISRKKSCFAPWRARER
jgi:hypothetical protein